MNDAGFVQNSLELERTEHHSLLDGSDVMDVLCETAGLSLASAASSELATHGETFGGCTTKEGIVFALT